MPSINSHYTKVAVIKRMFPISEGSDKKSLISHIEDYFCHIQPFEDKFSQDMEGAFGKDFLMFGPVVDIQQGDRAIVEEQEYRIVSVEKFNFRGKERHMECRLRIFE